MPDTTNTLATVPTTQEVVVKYVKHVGLLAALAAASIVLVTVLQTLGTLNVQALPMVYQGIAYLILPVLVAAGQKVKTEIDAQLTTVEAQKAVAKANAQLEAHGLPPTATL